MDRMQELAHDGADRLELLEATGFDEVAVVGLTLGSWCAALRAGM